jgi:hypothetical protein
MRLVTRVVIVLVILTGARFTFAQETTGTVAGRATDAQGLPVPGITVTATGPQG